MTQGQLKMLVKLWKYKTRTGEATDDQRGKSCTYYTAGLGGYECLQRCLLGTCNEDTGGVDRDLHTCVAHKGKPLFAWLHVRQNSPPLYLRLLFGDYVFWPDVCWR